MTMNPPARQVLKELEAERTSDWVLPSVQTETADFESRYRGGVAANRRAQIEDVRMHDLRHTVGTYAGQTGANAFLVRDLLAAQEPGNDRTLCEPGR